MIESTCKNFKGYKISGEPQSDIEAFKEGKRAA